MRGERHPTLGPAPRILLFVICLFGAVGTCSGQDQQPKRGFTPAGSFALSDIETINMVNGNLMLNFPLGKLPPARGGMSASINLLYNSKLWDTHVEYVPDLSNQISPQNFLGESEDGGWRYGISYQIRLLNRNQNMDDPPQCPDPHAFYIWKLQMIFPDGSSHDFRPTGFSDYNGEGYFTITPDGWESGCSGMVHTVTGPMTYFSTDGTYMRLVFTPGVGWTLSRPDGGRVVTDSASQRIYDRNNNYLEVLYVQNYNNSGEPATIVADQLGRSIALQYDASTQEDLIRSSGFNNEVLTWRVKWKTIEVNKSYTTTCAGCGRTRGGTSIQELEIPLRVVDRITLPEQAGGLTYIFGYNADTSNPSLGWGEVNSITLPSSAQATYGYWLDGNGPIQSDPRVDWVLDDHPTSKTLSYQQEYDGSSTPVTEVWQYAISHSGSSMTSPDGGVTTQTFGDISYPNADTGLIGTTTRPDGTLIENTWNQNVPYGLYASLPTNPFVKTEFTSIKDAAGNLSQTAIKDYSYDKNGNVTQVKEYDWVSYASTRGANGPIIPAGAPLKRATTNTYSRPTPDASDSTSNAAYSYWNQNAPALRNALASSEIGNGAATLARTEIFYDEAATTGNPTQKTTWDSTKGGYSNPLNPGNSVSVYTQYNQYGSPILTTDARGIQTQFVYGLVGSVTDLYPTQIKTAFQTSVQRTQTREYDFYTGAVTRVADADNNVSTSTTYDAFGRPTLVKAADGITGVETRTATDYSDVNRRVIVRSDLSATGDGKLVSIQHYDQLGRVRLSRQLEDSTTQSATDETTGIKVQTRYAFSGSNSYTLSSNPYRASTSGGAGSEGTMGWTRSTSDNSGRMIEVLTFGGSSLPAPWSNNTTSTGTVTTAYDANFTTVTDQAGKLRRSMTNGLGQLARVDEPGDPNTNNSLGTTDNPAQPTSYVYDTLGNLTTVNQGSQTRTFTYSSLARLLTAANPESGTLSYNYDANGNLLTKTDARSIVSTYVYDALNRATTRSYSDSTPTVTYTYDSVTAYGKGRLAAVSSSVSSYSYSAYDALGRALGGTQTIGSQSYSISNVAYDRAGHITSMTYPSIRAVTNTYDNAGRLSSFTGNLGDSTTRTYAAGISYDSANHWTREQFGTTTAALYNKRRYNNREQLYDMRVSTVNDDGDGNRGAIVNYYSLANFWGVGATGTDTNGNLYAQQHEVPDGQGGLTVHQQNYDYDSLNRIRWMGEYLNASQNTGGQSYSYDRYGNRTLSGSGNGINTKQFSIDPNTNRYGVPAGQSGTMTYDAAGNLTTDTYSAAAVTRVYDAENRMTKETQANNYDAGIYSYDGDGRRVKRTVGGATTWQVYGIGGELLAEYAATSPNPATPQKEYGYRNGELLITAEAATASAPAPSGLGASPASSSVALSWSAASGATNYRIERKGAGGSYASIGTTTSTSFTDSSSGNAYLYKVCAADGSNNCTSGYSNVVLGMAASFTDPTIISFADDPLNATPIRAAHVTELRTAVNAVRSLAGLPAASWTNPTLTPQVTQISADDVRDLRTNLNEALTTLGIQISAYTDPTLATGQYGTQVKRIHITELRQRVTNGTGGSGGSAGTSVQIHWLVTDQLGTPRMIIDQTGSLGGVSRHDYLPFGEELFAGTGGRTTAQGYSASDGVRQHFSQKERDNETGLDYFLARYYSSTQGRFTSPDDVLNDTKVADPASWNLYTYVRNNPLRLIDPTGEVVNGDGLTDAERQQLIDDWKKKTGYNNVYFDKKNNLVIDHDSGIAKDANGKFLGSADARANLTDAIETKDVFNLEHANGSSKVAFADNELTQTTTNAQTKETFSTYRVRIDFSDFKHQSGDREAIEANSIGLVVLHEIDHNLYGHIEDYPSGPNDPGAVENNYINPIREQLGLAQRATYDAKPITGPLRDAYRGYVQVRYTLNGKDRMLRWQDMVVGGVHR